MTTGEPAGSRTAIRNGPPCSFESAVPFCSYIRTGTIAGGFASSFSSGEKTTKPFPSTRSRSRTHMYPSGAWTRRVWFGPIPPTRSARVLSATPRMLNGPYRIPVVETAPPTPVIDGSASTSA